MTERVQQQVLGYLLGALDDSEMESVAERLRTDPEYRKAWYETQRRLRPLKQMDHSIPDVVVPPRLTQRTVDLVLERAQKSGPLASRRRGLSPTGSSHSHGRGGGYRFTWINLAVAGTLMLIAGMVLAPAVQAMRSQARLSDCAHNLYQLGGGLTQYSQLNHDLFPNVPAEGKLATPGIYAAELSGNGLLTDAHTLLCPESDLSDMKDFHIATTSELMSATGPQEDALKTHLGGSYGYSLDHWENGVLTPTHNRSREYFAIMADAPSSDRPGRQSANHNGFGQNVLFEDMHVKFLSSSHAKVGADDIFENDEHDVAPGMQSDDSVIVGSGAHVHYASLR